MYKIKEIDGVAYVYHHGERTDEYPLGLNKLVWQGLPADIPEEYKS